MQKIIRRFRKFKLYDWAIIVILFSMVIASFINIMHYPKNKGKGLFQCFYNEQGVLMQQNIEDRSYIVPRPAPKGVCVFKPPVGIEVLQVTLIGGGGGGSASKIFSDQRSFIYEPKINEYNLVGESYIAENPFEGEIDNAVFKEKVLNNFVFQIQGGNGSKGNNSNAIPGVGGICAINGFDIGINDKVIRTKGQNGLNGENGSDAKLVVENNDGKRIEMFATGGLGTLNIKEGGNVNGTCSIEKYAKKTLKNVNKDKTNIAEPLIQTFYKNFSVNSLIVEKQTEKIRIIKGYAGYRGEIVEFEMMNFKTPLRFCSKKGEKCHALVGIGGVGGTTNGGETRINSSLLSGKSGGDTVFLKYVAKGGLGANPRSDVASYLNRDSLSEKGEDGSFYANYAQEGAHGGDCTLMTCNGENARTIGGSGAGGAILYKTQTPLRTLYVAKIKDEKNRQIGNEIILNNKDEIQGKDECMTGNGGAGMGGAIIIRW